MADQDPQINPEELFTEDQTESTSEEAAEQVGVGTSSNNFELSKLRKPMTREPTPPTSTRDKTSIDNPTKKQPTVKSSVRGNPTDSSSTTSKGGGFGSTLGAIGSLGSRARNAFRRSGKGDELSPKEQAKQKKAEQKKEDRKTAVDAAKNIGALAASGGTNLVALAKLARDGLKIAKSKWKEIALGCLVPFLAIGIPITIFVLGLLNMLPGSKSGTTFGQTDSNLKSLTDLRERTSGTQADRARQIDVNEKVITSLFKYLQNLQTKVSADTSMSQTKRDALKTEINDTITAISDFSSKSSDEQKTDIGLAASEAIITRVNNLVDSLLKEQLGSPDPTTGFYKLPDSSDYVKIKESTASHGTDVPFWAKKDTIFLITVASAQFREKYPDYKLAIIYLSWPNGDQIDGADDKLLHRCGNDIDLGVAHKDDYTRTDGALMSYYYAGGKWNPNFNADGIPTTQKSFDAAMAKDVGEILYGLGVDSISFDYPLADYDNFETRLKGHQDHMYVALPGNNKFPDCVTKP